MKYNADTTDPKQQFVMKKAQLLKEKEEEENRARPEGFQTEKLEVREVDYLENDQNDRLFLRPDIYQVTIAALLSKEVNPFWEALAIKAAMQSFILQMCVLMGLFYDFSDFSNMQPMNVGSSFLRVISTMILHEQIFIELQDVVKLMEYLRRMKTPKKKPDWQRARLMSFILCFMQLSAALFSMFVLLGAQMQTPGLQ